MGNATQGRGQRDDTNDHQTCEVWDNDKEEEEEEERKCTLMLQTSACRQKFWSDDEGKEFLSIFDDDNRKNIGDDEMSQRKAEKILGGSPNSKRDFVNNIEGNSRIIPELNYPPIEWKGEISSNTNDWGKFSKERLVVVVFASFPRL